MARAGEEIYNPVQNDTIVWRKTARDTGGEVLSVDLFVSPHGGNPLHVHPRQEEYFKAVSGTFGVQVGDERRSIKEGEEVIIPPGTPHRWWNETEGDAHVLAELRPALNTEMFFETAYGLARDGKTNQNGIPNLLQQAVTLSGVNKGEIYLARPSIGVQKALLTVLAPVGKALGYKDHYRKYSGVGGAGPPSTTRIMEGGVAIAAPLVAVSLFLVGRVRHRNRG